MNRSILLRVAIPFMLVGVWLARPAPGTEPRIEKDALGATPDGSPVDRYTLTNASGMEVAVLTYGAMLTTVRVPDRQGKLDSVTLYLDPPQEYLKRRSVFGSTIGRFANRIAGARFSLDGIEHRLAANAGPHQIHGGRNGFHTVVWKAVPVREPSSVGVRLTHTSPDGHEGFPGTLEVQVVYRLTNANELQMQYEAQTDKPTCVNLTNHAYWNLAGAASGDVLNQVLTIRADHYLPTDDKNIPTGQPRPVRDTPMDFNEPKTIGSRIDRLSDRNYDHCYVIARQPGDQLTLAARAHDPASGRGMEVHTTQPGVQLYTASGLRLQAGRVSYGPYAAFCLETQHFPDSPNRPEFPSTVLRPGETFRHQTVHKFFVE